MIVAAVAVMAAAAAAAAVPYLLALAEIRPRDRDHSQRGIAPINQPFYIPLDLFSLVRVLLEHGKFYPAHGGEAEGVGKRAGVAHVVSRTKSAGSDRS